jgi:hypothetical protein
MDEKDRLAVALVDESQVKPVMMEELHGASPGNPSKPSGCRYRRPRVRT